MMNYSVAENARAVLLPAFDSLKLSDEVRRFLDHGGVSVLLGESREEYVTRAMSAARRQAERADDFRALAEDANARCGQVIVAVDQELAGICRLHDLVAPFPNAVEARRMDQGDLEALCAEVGRQARAMGVNLFLSPVLDTLGGSNPWLKGRTLSGDPSEVGRVASAYIRGVRAGGVATCAKHFPGFASTTGDPAIDPLAVCDASHEVVEIGLKPFRSAIAAGTDMMMVGPAPVLALDAQRAALRSTIVIGLLKETLGFKGIVMADDLDGQATLRGDSVSTVAVEALNAGCDYLLMADTGSQISDVTEAIVDAVNSGKLLARRLADSAQKIRSFVNDQLD